MKTACIPLLLVALTPCAFAAQGGPGDEHGKNPFEGLGQDIARVHLTFDSTQQRMTDAEASVLASRLSAMSGVALNLDQGRSGPDERVFTNDTDPSTILDVDLRNGSFLFNAGMNGLRGEMETPDLPDKDHAGRIARRHLETLNRLPKPRQMVLEHIGGLNMMIHREDGTNDDYRKLVTVRFERRADDLPVIGTGGRIIVKLGEHGRLRGLIFNWEHYAPRVVSDAEKLTALEVATLASLRLGFLAPDAVEKSFETVDVVYFDDGFGVMEPAVHIVASLTFVTPVSGQSGEVTIENPFDFYIPLLRAPLGYYPYMEDQGVPPPIRD